MSTLNRKHCITYVRSKIIVIACLLCLVAYTKCKAVNISNVEPRRDTKGTIMDIHDGTLTYFAGQYYYFGASYGLCKEPPGESGCSDIGVGKCGFQLDHNVSLYTSSDLKTWDFKGHVFEMKRDSPVEAILFCPKVLYNALTKQW